MALKLTMGILIFLSVGIMASDKNINSKAKRKPSRSIAALDNFHTYLTEGILKVSNRLDYFFGGIRVDEESNETYGRISFELKFQESKKIRVLTRQRIRMNLPGTIKKLKLIFDKDAYEDENRGSLEQVNQDNDTGFDAALRYVVKRKAKLDIHFDGGLRIRRTRPLNPFIRLRNRFSWEPTEKFQIRFVNEIYYFARTYGVVEARLDFDYSFSENVLLRLGNFTRWRDTNDYFQFYNTLSLYHELGNERAIGYHLEAVGNNEVKTTYESYSVYVQYRQQIYKDWLHIELKPQVRFPKINDFNPELAFSFKFEILFGNY